MSLRDFVRLEVWPSDVGITHTHTSASRLKEFQVMLLEGHLDLVRKRVIPVFF